MSLVKILVIDDLEEIRKLYAAFFSKRGFTILEAKNGAEGLSIAQQQVPDLVLLDLRLPDMSGMDVLKKIRTLNNNTKIVMLSGLEDEELKYQALQAGAAAFFPKTVDIREIVEAVSRMFS